MKFRNELKYLLNYRDYSLIKSRLHGILKQDSNVNLDGFYTVRSLYFDDFYNSAYNEKLMGIKNRQKYRIRIYDGSDMAIFLERKIKSDRYIYKQKTSLSKKELEKIIKGSYDFLIRTQDDLKNIFYFECTSNLLRPRVIAEYEREPFVIESGNVRITFDKNIRAGMIGFDIFDKYMPLVEALDPNLLVMEVKYTEFLPTLVRDLLPAKAADNVAVSKYVLCCDQTLHKRQFAI